MVHKLFLRQLVKARRADNTIDIDRLAELVSAAYDEQDVDRRRTNRSMTLMIEELERTHERLVDAINVVPLGIAIFDAEDRYVLWNKRYAEMHDLSNDELAVGAKFEDAVRGGLSRGQYPEAVGREEEWLHERLAAHRSPQSIREQQMGGDRWFRVEEQRTADGGSIGIRIEITDLKRREASFRLLFDHNPIPMWVSDRETMLILAANDAAVERYGYTRDQFIGMSVLQLIPEEDRVAEAGLARTHEGKLPGASHRNVTADGSIIEVEVYVRWLTYYDRPARLVGCIDITDRRRAEEEARDARTFLDTIVENTPAPIIVKSAVDRRYILVNRAAEQLFGAPRQVIVGKTADELFSSATAQTTNDRDTRALAAEAPVSFSEHSFETPGNGTRLVTTRRAVVRDQTGPRYLIGFIDDVTERKLAEERITYLAYHDVLTGNPNRAAFIERITDRIERSQESGEPFAVVCLDLDRFKEINDVFGHSVGDRLLRAVGTRLQTTADGTFVARMGGDEFLLLMEDANRSSIDRLAKRLQQAVSEDIEIDGRRFKIELSVGVALYPIDGTDVTTLLANADAALYRGKGEGRGNIRFFAAAIDRQLHDQRVLQHQLDAAITNDEFVLHYQPQATIDGRLIGFEALVRWQHPERGLLPPAEFISLAETSGRIAEIGEWVLRTACREAVRWPAPLSVSVNLSPIQIQRGDIPALVHSVLLETGLAPQRLELEITEGVLIANFDGALAALRRLKAIGTGIVMDDLGSGHSSLAYLQSFPFDKIKIDKSFVANLDNGAQARAIIRAVLALGRSLELPVMAEGVETETQRQFLQREKCDEMQGFLLGRPLPIAEYAGVIARSVTRPKRTVLRRA